MQNLDNRDKIIFSIAIIIILTASLKLLLFNYLSYFEVFSAEFLTIFILYITNILFDEILKFEKIYKLENYLDIFKQSIIIFSTFFLVIIPAVYLLLFIMELI